MAFYVGTRTAAKKCGHSESVACMVCAMSSSYVVSIANASEYKVSSSIEYGVAGILCLPWDALHSAQVHIHKRFRFIRKEAERRWHYSMPTAQARWCYYIHTIITYIIIIIPFRHVLGAHGFSGSCGKAYTVSCFPRKFRSE